jgi:DNA-binding transcriptional LysR family regulator
MELYQLRSFVTVANEGHLTRAAKRLFISQPAVSAHIKALEEELGVVLFTRTPHGMTLTKEGELLKVQAEKSLNDIDKLFQQAQLLQHKLAGTAKIGLNTHPDFLKTAEFFSVMKGHYPHMEFHLLQRSSWEVPDELRKGNLDAAYKYGKDLSPEFVVVPLQTLKVYIVGPVHWKKQIERADWKEIAEFPWIWVPENCHPFDKIIEEAFQKRHLKPSKVAMVDEEETLKTLVTSGVGLSVMVEEEALASEKEGEIAIWPKDQLEVDLSFVYLRERKNDLVIQAILNGIFIVWDITGQ